MTMYIVPVTSVPTATRYRMFVIFLIVGLGRFSSQYPDGETHSRSYDDHDTHCQALGQNPHSGLDGSLVEDLHPPLYKHELRALYDMSSVEVWCFHLEGSSQLTTMPEKRYNEAKAIRGMFLIVHRLEGNNARSSGSRSSHMIKAITKGQALTKQAMKEGDFQPSEAPETRPTLSKSKLPRTSVHPTRSRYCHFLGRSWYGPRVVGHMK